MSLRSEIFMDQREYANSHKTQALDVLRTAEATAIFEKLLIPSQVQSILYRQIENPGRWSMTGFSQTEPDLQHLTAVLSSKINTRLNLITSGPQLLGYYLTLSKNHRNGKPCPDNGRSHDFQLFVAVLPTLPIVDVPFIYTDVKNGGNPEQIAVGQSIDDILTQLPVRRDVRCKHQKTETVDFTYTGNALFADLNAVWIHDKHPDTYRFKQTFLALNLERVVRGDDNQIHLATTLRQSEILPRL